MKKLNKKPWKFLSKKQLHKKKIERANERVRIENSKELNKNEKVK
ncbi:MAG: hypothetical protein OHM56_02235 [Spiroplasma phoeniceum]|nr:MAG: hypothetical protein OHM57_01680 [Spiroplasma phoeniceum]UZQ32798.1 MAG: hypothetical protein OHM56_02235 [Spiroplasma phoeniceum]